MVTLATLCYLQKDNQTLMFCSNKRGHFKENIWNGLGGKFEKGETPEDCIIREVEEESGYKIKDPKLKGILLFPDQNESDWLVFVYTATKFKGKLTQSNEGRVEWIDNKEISKLAMSEGDYIFLPWVFENKFFSAKFIYKDGKLKNYNVAFPIA